MSDKRLGKHGEYEPKLCAKTGQAVQGRHASAYNIGNGYYIRILEKAAMKMTVENMEVLRKKMKALIPTAQPKPKSKLSKALDSDQEKGS